MTEKSSTDPAISGFVLAGGKSLRMGQDKAAMEFHRHSLLDHMVRLLSTVTDPVRIVGRHDLPDKVPNCGPLGGILTALEASGSPMNLVVAVDLPLLTPAFLAWFCGRMTVTPSPLLACRVGNDFPLCLGIHRRAEPEVAERIRAGILALHRFIREFQAEVIPEAEIAAAGFPAAIFHNVNTPEDWKQLNP